MRLGLHRNGPGHSDLWRRYVERVRPEVVKLLDNGWDPGLVDHARQHGAKVIARRVIGMPTLGPEGREALQAQRRWAADRGWHMDYLEAANEEWTSTPEYWDRLSEYMLEHMRALDFATGGRVKGVIYNASVGAPTLECWSRDPCLRALEYAAEHGHLIGIHEYYKPRPWYGVEGEGTAPLGRARGWWMLRCQRMVDIWRAELPRTPRFVITESGRDDIPGTPGTGKGWRDEPVTPDGDYAALMAWYCRYLTYIPECAGVVDFGFDGTPSGWESFDLARAPAMLDRMADEMVRLPRGVTIVPDATLAAEAAAHQVIELNPTAAIQKAARQRGYWPTSDEWTSHAPTTAGHPAQRFEDPLSGRVFVGSWNPATGKVTWTELFP